MGRIKRVAVGFAIGWGGAFAFLAAVVGLKALSAWLTSLVESGALSSDGAVLVFAAAFAGVVGTAVAVMLAAGS